MSTIKRYQDLRIWKQGIEIVKEIYKSTEHFPKTEIYGLSSQMQRAAVSIPSNIAEGHNRSHQKEFRQFLNIALGSCGELETQLVIAKELDFLNETKFNDLSELIQSEAKQTRALLQKITSNQLPAASNRRNHGT